MEPPREVIIREKDDVTEVQDAVDRLALAMFDAIRFLPETRENQQEWDTRVKELGGTVVTSAREVRDLVGKLGGVDRTATQQLEELKELSEKSRAAQEGLRVKTEEAQELLTKIESQLFSAAMVLPA
jgi:DNA-binding ferritin-like protein (Dps family)